MTRALPLLATTLAGLLLVPAVGCFSPWFASRDQGGGDKLADLMSPPDAPDLVRDASSAYGVTYAKAESVALVNGLLGTGGEVRPSQPRDLLIAEMNTHDVPEPNLFLDSGETAMVTVDAVLPPGARRGDPIDLILKNSQHSSATSLKGGWLMPTRLRQMQLIRSAVRTSEVLATGTGAVLIRGNHEPGDDPSLLTEGMVLGGGILQKDRPLGLVIRPEYQHVMIAAKLASAVNRRYYFFDGSTRRGVADAKGDDYISVDVHPRYRRNVHRQMAVIGGLGVQESAAQTRERIERLGRELQEPTTAADAALQLEGIGPEGVPTLLAAVQSPNAEIRFYAAEALAYLDRIEAIEPLEELIRTQPAFRHNALLALSGFEERLAAQALQRLLNEPSNEVRFGAFRALRRRADRELLVPGQPMGNHFILYEIPSTAEPLVAISLSQRPEIVVFGGPARVAPPDYLFAGTGVLLRPEGEDKIRVSRFLPDREDRRLVVTTDAADVVRGVAAVGGGYGDAVETLRLLKAEGHLQARLAIDPQPRPLRTYYREGDAEERASDVAPEDISPPRPESQRVWYNPLTWWG